MTAASPLPTLALAAAVAGTRPGPPSGARLTGGREDVGQWTGIFRQETRSVVQERPAHSDECDGWLERFHAGDRDVLGACYEDHFGTVSRAVGRVLHGADRETVVHEVFLALIAEERVRRSFRGGAFRAWLSTMARRRAIDYARRHGRERLVEPAVADALHGGASRAGDSPERIVEGAEARRIVADFVREILPEKWREVFEARFLRQLSQREAARALGMRRTTLAYQEMRVRGLLRRFVLRQRGAEGVA